MSRYLDALLHPDPPSGDAMPLVADPRPRSLFEDWLEGPVTEQSGDERTPPPLSDPLADPQTPLQQSEAKQAAMNDSDPIARTVSSVTERETTQPAPSVETPSVQPLHANRDGDTLPEKTVPPPAPPAVYPVAKITEPAALPTLVLEEKQKAIPVPIEHDVPLPEHVNIVPSDIQQTPANSELTKAEIIHATPFPVESVRAEPTPSRSLDEPVPQPSPVVIEIGHLEVRLMTASSTSIKPQPKVRPVVSLAEYLGTSGGGGER